MTLDQKALAAALAKAEADRTIYAQTLQKLRSTLHNVTDAIEDEGDRRYFGSTNDADDLKQIAEDIEALIWDDIMEQGEPPRDLYAEMRALNDEIRQLKAAAALPAPEPVATDEQLFGGQKLSHLPELATMLREYYARLLHGEMVGASSQLLEAAQVLEGGEAKIPHQGLRASGLGETWANYRAMVQKASFCEARGQRMDEAFYDAIQKAEDSISAALQSQPAPSGETK